MEPLQDRMPPLARESMDELQRAAVDELITSPTNGRARIQGLGSENQVLLPAVGPLGDLLYLRR